MIFLKNTQIIEDFLKVLFMHIFVAHLRNMIEKQGLYLPDFEHENCGAGFICNLKGEKTNQIIHDALEILVKLEQRGGVSADGKTGDGAGLLIDIPHDYFKRVCDFDIPQQREYAVGMVFYQKMKTNINIVRILLKQKLKLKGFLF